MSTFSAHDEVSRAIYDRFWQQAREPLLRGEVITDPVPTMNSSRWGVSIIMHLRGEVADHLLSITDQLAQWTGRNHVLHTPASLHTTVNTLECYRGPVPQDDAFIAQSWEIAQNLGRQFAPLKIRYRGLTATQMSIITQGWALDDSLQRFRIALQDQLRTCGLLQGPEENRVRDLAHCSLIVFAGPLLDPQRCVTFIDEHRDTDFGLARTSTLELVYYRRSEYSAEPVTLATIPLQA